jgi:Mce-associated membrane protein
MPTALDTRPDQDATVVPREDGADESGARPSPRFRLVLLVVLAVVLALATAVAGYLAATRADAHLGVGGAQSQLQGDRDAVMAQAEQFMLRVNTYGPEMLDGETMPAYREQVTAVLTPKYAEDFEKNVGFAEQTVVQSGVGRAAEVFSTGVSLIDADSATALVAGSFTSAYPEQPRSDERVEIEPAPFRVQVKLLKIDGKWLVDDFTPLTGEELPTDGEADQ